MDDLGSAQGRRAAISGERVKPPATAHRPRAARGYRFVPIVIIAALLVAWEVLARADLIQTLFFPAPSSTAARLLDMSASGELVTDLYITASRLVRGFLLGATAGVVAGLLLGISRSFHDAVNPLIALAHPIPKIALLPLFLLIFGLGDAATVAIVAASSFFPMVINTTLGVREISPELFEVTASYKASRATVLRRVVLPGSLPAVIAGMRLALNAAIVVTIAVELVSSSEGLGANVWMAWQTLRTEELYATLAVIALLGVGTNALLGRLEERLAPWKTA